MDSAALAGQVWAEMDFGHALLLVILLIVVLLVVRDVKGIFRKSHSSAAPPDSICKKDLELMVERLRNEFRDDVQTAINGLGERFGKALHEHDQGNQRDFKIAEESNSRRFAAVEAAIANIGKKNGRPGDDGRRDKK